MQNAQTQRIDRKKPPLSKGQTIQWIVWFSQRLPLKNGDRRTAVEGFQFTTHVGGQRESPRHSFAVPPPFDKGGLALSDPFPCASCAFCNRPLGVQCYEIKVIRALTSSAGGPPGWSRPRSSWSCTPPGRRSPPPDLPPGSGSSRSPPGPGPQRSDPAA